MLSFKIVNMVKGMLEKKRARKIVNCYRMFAELRETLAGGRALDIPVSIYAFLAAIRIYRTSEWYFLRVLIGHFGGD